MKRNKFSLSHYNLFSMKMGELVPFGLVEVLPGDTFQHSASALVRCSPLVAPVMHPIHVRIHHWFVPHRLVWSSWENFITGGPDGNDASVFPTIEVPLPGTVSSLADYLGIPQGMGGTGNAFVSALPFRAYGLIFNEWYRDQDLVSPLTVSLADGADTTTNTALQNVAWEKDYFTTARPWTQKGPQVTIPINVTGIGITQAAGSTGPYTVTDSTGATVVYNPAVVGSTAGVVAIEAKGSGAPLTPTIAGQVTVNDLRLSMALQRYEEARARFGSRYTEYLRYLGVRSSDARLQRPEYLGGGKQTIQFSEVLQTGVTTSGTAAGVGNFGGHGIAATRSNRYRRFFEEHGYVISCISIKPRTVYAQSINRTWLRTVKEDFWQQELQHIGQQEIWQAELYGLTTGSQKATFGYQDRYDEYRRQESRVGGQFRQSILDFWHAARIFTADPVLNSSFVTSNPTNRIFADETGDDTLYVMAAHSLQARRLLSKSGQSFIL